MSAYWNLKKDETIFMIFPEIGESYNRNSPSLHFSIEANPLCFLLTSNKTWNFFLYLRSAILCNPSAGVLKIFQWLVWGSIPGEKLWNQHLLTLCRDANLKKSKSGRSCEGSSSHPPFTSEQHKSLANSTIKTHQTSQIPSPSLLPPVSQSIPNQLKIKSVKVDTYKMFLCVWEIWQPSQEMERISL